MQLNRELIEFLADRQYYARIDLDDGEIHVRGGPGNGEKTTDDMASYPTRQGRADNV